MSGNEFDVAVIGGGTAGSIAAIAAARMGARTCVIDANGFLGGTCLALGNALPFHNSRGETVVKGLPQEFINRMIDVGGAHPKGHLANLTGIGGSFTPLDPDAMKYVLFEMAEAADVQIILHTIMVAPIVKAGRVQGVRVHNKSGLQDIRATVTIDATGDADVATGAEVEVTKDVPEAALNGTLLFRVSGVHSDRFVDDLRRNPQKMVLLSDPYLREVRGLTPEAVMADRVHTIYDIPYVYLANLVRDYIPRDHWPEWGITGIEKSEWGDLKGFGSRFNLTPAPTRADVFTINATSITFDATDGHARSRAEQIGHKQIRTAIELLRRYVPGYGECAIHSVQPAVSIRASRRIVGRYQLTRDDVENQRRFPDGIARGSYPMSVQSESNPNVRQHLFVRGGGDYDIPYRCLVPRDVDGLLVAGRCLSATREASGSARLGAQCMAYGHAAGVAAALAAAGKVSPESLDYEMLRTTLENQGAVV